MRPTPARLPDELLAPACATLGVGSSDEALANPAVRAAIQATVRAQLHPNPRARVAPAAPRHHARAAAQSSFGFDGSVDIKRRAANDLDED